MTEWTLSKLLSGLHDDIQQKLNTIRGVVGHPGTKGDASEKVWLELLQEYLPKRYQAASAFVVDSKGVFSEQIDIVIFDRQYSPFIFKYNGITVVPAESVYAVFEAKQSANLGHVQYAQKKVASVRRLFRSSLPIPHAGGTYPPKALIPILGGLLTFDSDWNPAMGDSFKSALKDCEPEERLDLGCIAAHGHYMFESKEDNFLFFHEGKPATAFLFELIAKLQFSGTVPMIDIHAYAKWLST